MTQRETTLFSYSANDSTTSMFEFEASERERGGCRSAIRRDKARAFPWSRTKKVVVGPSGVPRGAGGAWPPGASLGGGAGPACRGEF